MPSWESLVAPSDKGDWLVNAMCAILVLAAVALGVAAATEEAPAPGPVADASIARL